MLLPYEILLEALPTRLQFLPVLPGVSTNFDIVLRSSRRDSRIFRRCAGDSEAVAMTCIAL
ncbi:hypothetical protein IE077_002108 [Cardiosporidium cionae]|uniref:Uncharacterized protein n=1 Tax=Cardiosporidium cionae TaxID=476202 RepID=A0ABQ7J4U8_9APIC|nr:hypothetical protein IE077_002108 [Cardiosporidium cionae]|eukprot:KAF8818371.1 hypothetical protein IE077_002108 [Cardiosporidium cionae]